MLLNKKRGEKRIEGGHTSDWAALMSDSFAYCTSSEASSSISVVSVPLEVTGDGPTISLGLKTPVGLDDILFIASGRKDAESVAE